MEESISTAARVRRQLKAGRPRSVQDVKDLNSFKAMGILVSQADRAQELMQDAGLDPNDVRLGLIVRTAKDIMCKWFPAPEEAGPFFAAICDLAGAQFLGVLWHQTDREIQADGIPRSTYWVTPFVAEPEAQRQMLALRDFITAGGLRMQAN